MKTLSANLKAHLQGETLTVCTLWKITRADGQVFGFTDNSRNVVYSGVTYEAATGHTPSNVRTSADFAVDNLEVESVLDSATITVADIEAGLWDYAEVTIMIVNYLSLADGHMTLRRGWLGNVRTGRSSFVAELRGMLQPLQQVIGRAFTAGCNADLGDSRCGIVLGSYTIAGTVTAVTDRRTFVDSGQASSSGYFDGGLLTWTSGDNDTYSMEVKTFAAGGAFVLQQPMPNDVQIGDTFQVYAGCDKSLATCRDKFDNVVNFRGFPYVPGQDRMVAGK
jgi:uncharacterized phage protein (TIGR02218 family)